MNSTSLQVDNLKLLRGQKLPIYANVIPKLFGLSVDNRNNRGKHNCTARTLVQYDRLHFEY